MVKLKHIFLLAAVIGMCMGCESSDEGTEPDVQITCSPSEITAGYEGKTETLVVTCEKEWTLYSDEDWIDCKQSSGTATVTIAQNTSETGREGKVIIKSRSTRVPVPVKQDGKPETPGSPDIDTPDGYKLVWHDEFDEGTEPLSENWWYETGAGGWGNNELQNYVAGKHAGEQLAKVENGVLRIICKKIDGNVYSIRMNTNENWKYGYFEARLKLPSGKGTWPAFWMMPKNYTAWPDDGEIDIMEEVGYNPNYVSSSVHCNAYNHSIGTQKTKETLVAGAQTDFHVYALEWTEDYIRTYVDGEELFYFPNDKSGKKETWPFNAPFCLKLNLAWGGDWGGAQGVDESCLPATYEVDYVRVFQKK